MTSCPTHPASPAPASMLKSISLYGVAQAANGLVPLLTVPIFARAIGPDDYGVWDMVGAAMVIGIMLGNWGLQAAYSRFYFAYAGDPAKQKRLLGTVVGFSSLCLAAVCTIFFVARDSITAMIEVPLKWAPLLMLAVVFGSLRHLEEFFLLYFRNSERAAAYMRWDILRLGVQTALAMVMVLAFHYGIYALGISGLAAYAVLFLALAWRLGLRDCFAIDRDILKECLLFGWPLMTKVVMSVLSIVVSRWMLTHLTHTTEYQGVFGRANSLAYLVFMFMITLENAYAPRWNQALFKTGRISKTLGRLFTEHACMSSFVALGLILLSQEFVTLMLPPSYRGAQALVIVLALYYALLAIQQIQGAVLHYLKMTKSQMAVVFGSYLVQVIVLLVMIPRWQAMGTAVGTLACGVLTIVAIQWLLAGRHRIGYETGKLLFLYGSLTVSAGVALACTAGWIAYWPGLALRLAMFAGLTAGWVRVLGWDVVSNVAGRLLCRPARA